LIDFILYFNFFFSVSVLTSGILLLHLLFCTNFICMNCHISVYNQWKLMLWYYICHILSKYFSVVVDWFFLNPNWESQKISAVYGSNFISSALVNMFYLPPVRRFLWDYDVACRLPTLCILQIMTFLLFWHFLLIPDIPYRLVNNSF